MSFAKDLESVMSKKHARCALCSPAYILIKKANVASCISKVVYVICNIVPTWVYRVNELVLFKMKLKKLIVQFIIEL